MESFESQRKKNMPAKEDWETLHTTQGYVEFSANSLLGIILLAHKCYSPSLKLNYRCISMDSAKESLYQTF